MGAFVCFYWVVCFRAPRGGRGDSQCVCSEDGRAVAGRSPVRQRLGVPLSWCRLCNAAKFCHPESNDSLLHIATMVARRCR